MAKKKVAINGFGRIGRMFFRAAMQDEAFTRSFEIVAVNDLASAGALAYLLKYDSVHGKLSDKIFSTETTISFNAKELDVLAHKDVLKLPWKRLGIDYVVESTGKNSDRNAASQHLTAGAEKVVVTAPSKNADATLLPGVNMENYDAGKHNVVSMASCTTNSVAPLLKLLNEEYGIAKGFLTTVHAYTNDQRILDLAHERSLRRSRAAALSIIPASTGAADAVVQAIPELAGKLDAIALRVPVPCGSISDLSLLLLRSTTSSEVNSVIRKAADGKLKGILGYTEEEIVSSDVIDDPRTGIVDGSLTAVVGKDLAKVYSWYDNEWGYSVKLVDLLKHIAKK